MDEYVKIAFSYNGREQRMILPRLLHMIPIAHNMHFKTIEFILSVAKKNNREIKYIVDVGASIGAWTVAYSFIFPDAEILAIEPSKYNMLFLEHNCKDLNSTKLLKLIMHDEKDSVRIAAPTPLQRPDVPIDRPESGLISVYGTSEHYAELVDADTLDNVVEKRVDWLKIDVEGHEMPVLNGAERILKEDRPVLQIEIRDINQAMAGGTSWKLLQYITARKYCMVGDMRGDLVFVPNERMK